MKIRRIFSLTLIVLLSLSLGYLPWVLESPNGAWGLESAKDVSCFKEFEAHVRVP